MWNHSSKSAKAKEIAAGGELLQKVEKHLDLTNYLNFLQNLFTLSTSDSEGSDLETTCDTVDAKVKILTPKTGTSSSFNLQSKSSQSLLRNAFSSSTSTNSSAFSQEEENAFIPSDLAAMSDLELNNLLKRTNYLGTDVDVDPTTFDLDAQDTAGDSDEKIEDKKKKKKRPPKKKANADQVQRNNRPNSGGRGNGHGSSKGGAAGGGGGGGCNNGPVPDNSGNSGSRGSSNNNSGGGSSSGGGSHVKNNSKCARNLSLNCFKLTKNNTPTSVVTENASFDISSKSAKLSLTTNKTNARVISNNVCFGGFQDSDIKKPNNMPSLYNGSLGLQCHDSSDDNDNDSLSDYMSMAAVAAVPPSQAPARPSSSISDEGYFRFEELSSGSSSLESQSKSDDDEDDDDEESTLGSEGGKRKKLGTGKQGESSKRKKLSLYKQLEYIEKMNQTRKNLYVFIARKEVIKAHRDRVAFQKEAAAARRRLVQSCNRVFKQKEIQAQKTQKESAWRTKRLTKEMQSCGKQVDKDEKDVQKQKEDDEQRKQDIEIWEAKRKQQKLNFLITQTELFAHIMSKNINSSMETDATIQNCILNQLIYEQGNQEDNDDIGSMKHKAKLNVQEAVHVKKAHIQLFDASLTHEIEERPHSKDKDNPTPAFFSGDLKNYQLEGLNWLDDLFDKGLDGILADEIGLSKNIMSIAFLAHIAEKYGIWGPFLILAPVSTLHNWQQEIKRFVPEFKVVPYWGNPQERKILRQFWKQADLHTSEASFHVVVTSSNVVLQDMKYFNKVKWQYLIVDEAQAIKTTTSSRWKALMGFSCRNRLLLTGTPIQNTISELWSLLQFTMPSLFDSKDFIDWFASNQEFPLENGCPPDEKLMTRLFTILKPFLLRRTKKDVESELCDKIEILVPCLLSNRQRFFHTALVRKILMDDMLKNSSSSSPTNATTSLQQQQQISRNLMTVLVQFRKISNHPSLFERRDMKSPFFMKSMPYNLPKLLKEEIGPISLQLQTKFNIFNPANIHYSLFRSGYNSTRRRISNLKAKVIQDLHIENLKEENCGWSFVRYSGLSTGDILKFSCDKILERIKCLVNLQDERKKMYYRRMWDKSINQMSSSDFLIENDGIILEQFLSTTMRDLVFTINLNSFYTWTNSSNQLDNIKMEPGLDSVITENSSEPTFDLEPLFMPKFLNDICMKVKSEGFQPIYLQRQLNEDRYQLSNEVSNAIMYGLPEELEKTYFTSDNSGGLLNLNTVHGWSGIVLPDKEKLVTDSGKLKELDILLKTIKENNQQVLIYSVMPAMLDILEEYLRHRKWAYNRLDGYSNGNKNDNADTKYETFVSLLATRIDGFGLNLSEFDCVIFYDSDWNLFAEHQEANLIQRIGQTKQVTIYRFFCKGTVEERILQMIKDSPEEGSTTAFNNGQFRLDLMKPKELLSLFLDDDEADRKSRQRQILDKKCVEKSTEKTSQVNLVDPTKSSTQVSVQTSDAVSTMCAAETESTNAVSSGGSLEEDSPHSSIDESDEMDCDVKYSDAFGLTTYDDDMNPSTSDYFDDYSSAIDWNGSMSDYEEGLGFIPKNKVKLTRGTGKRGRPPSRVRVQMRDLGGVHSMRRGPGRPRIKPIGPLNQGIRGRGPGRPPLSRKSDAIIPASLPALSPVQRVFGIYNPDLNLSFVQP